eukprot:5465481-Amphidinium_carterae.1
MARNSQTRDEAPRDLQALPKVNLAVFELIFAANACSNWSFVRFYGPTAGLKKLPEEERRSSAQTSLKEADHMLQVWTDGSAESGTSRGGCGVCFTFLGSVLAELSGPGGLH